MYLNKKAMKEINNVEDFNAVISQDKPVLLDFYADWCGPCQTLLPTLDKLSTKHQGDYVIAKVNVDTNPILAQKFHVRSIPALFFIKDGEIVDKAQGLQPSNVLEKKLAAIKGKTA